MRILSVFIFLLLLGGNVSAAEGEVAVLYVPNLGQKSTYVPLEIVMPGETNPRGQTVMQGLKAKMGKLFHLAGSADKEIGAKCLVAVHQLVPQDVPVFRMECWSSVQWSGGQSYAKLGEAESPEKVLAFTRVFAEEHLKRVRQSVPLKQKPVSVRVA